MLYFNFRAVFFVGEHNVREFRPEVENRERLKVKIGKRRWTTIMKSGKINSPSNKNALPNNHSSMAARW
jgi:hypothetical protein